MQDMIKRIVQADNEVKALKEANEQAAEKEKQRIEAEAEAIYRKYMDDAKVEIEKDKEYLDKLFEKKTTEIKEKQDTAMQKLRQTYEQNHDKWVDELVERVLS